jgi:chloramphenicol 3-O-phosphotransferase
LLEANLRSIRSYLDSGFNVLGELFMWYATGLEIAARVFGGIEPFIIELTCRLDVLESREKQRGTTHVGFARSQVESRKLAIPADVTLDSEIMSTIQLTEAVLAAWAR